MTINNANLPWLVLPLSAHAEPVNMHHFFTHAVTDHVHHVLHPCSAPSQRALHTPLTQHEYSCSALAQLAPHAAPMQHCSIRFPDTANNRAYSAPAQLALHAAPTQHCSMRFPDTANNRASNTPAPRACTPLARPLMPPLLALQDSFDVLQAELQADYRVLLHANSQSVLPVEERTPARADARAGVELVGCLGNGAGARAGSEESGQGAGVEGGAKGVGAGGLGAVGNGLSGQNVAEEAASGETGSMAGATGSMEVAPQKGMAVRPAAKPAKKGWGIVGDAAAAKSKAIQVGPVQWLAVGGWLAAAAGSVARPCVCASWARAMHLARVGVCVCVCARAMLGGACAMLPMHAM